MITCSDLSTYVAATPFISLRLDADTQRALRLVSQYDGVDRSTYVRALIMDAVADRLSEIAINLGGCNPALGVEVDDAAPAEAA